MPNSITHFEIMGKDAVNLQDFYRRVFGWKLSPPMPEFGNYSTVDRDGKGIGGGIGEGEPRVTIYAEVDDPQAYLDKAIAAGAKMLMPVTHVMEGVTIAMFADPAGNMTGIVKEVPR
jgi:predicted enzyme related to lactoylglutathione lyase